MVLLQLLSAALAAVAAHAAPSLGQAMVCHTGTVCAAAYSGNRQGCCPYDEAVCCPNKQTCCPAGTSCNDTGTYLTQCVPAKGGRPTAGRSVCKPGAHLPPSTALPNVLIIGDSVSIGYTPPVAAHMAKVALVQHSPWDVMDGGAEETAYGVQCLDYFLRNPQGVRLKPDVIMFNWGLHDTQKGPPTPGQSGSPEVYAAELANITMQLQAKEPQAKLLFGLTSPMLCNAGTDAAVVELNKQAAAIMAKNSVPTVDLHGAITGRCGAVPQASCFNMTGCFCPHCGGRPEGQGYDWLASSTIVPALTHLLGSKAKA